MTKDITILNPTLLSFDYYWSKVSMFLRESYGIKDRFKNIYFDLILAINNAGIKFFDVISNFILEKNLDTLANIEEFKDQYRQVENPKANEMYHYFELVDDEYVLAEAPFDSSKTYYIRYNEIVDMISALAGINREIKVNNSSVILNSTEMIILSRLQFYALGFDGSFENLKEIYERVLDNFAIYYITTGSLTVSIIVLINDLDVSLIPNLINVLTYAHDEYLLESLGINYSVNFLTTIENVFTFRSEPYTFVQVEHPVAEDINTYYELIDGEYVPATTFDPDNIYYIPEKYKQVDIPIEDDLSKYYEKINGEYVPASEPFDPNKTYYYQAYHDYLDDDKSLLL